MTNCVTIGNCQIMWQRMIYLKCSAFYFISKASQNRTLMAMHFWMKFSSPTIWRLHQFSINFHRIVWPSVGVAKNIFFPVTKFDSLVPETVRASSFSLVSFYIPVTKKNPGILDTYFLQPRQIFKDNSVVDCSSLIIVRNFRCGYVGKVQMERHADTLWLPISNNL